MIMPLDVLKTNVECQKVKKKHWKIKCPRIESWENSQETSLCTGEKPWFLAYVPSTKSKNGEWTMAHVGFRDCAGPSPASTLPDVLLESLKPQKMGRSVAIFPRKNDDNLMDVGFQFKHVLQLVVWICLDCQILQHFDKITKTLAGHASILSKLNFAASFG